MSPHVSSPPPVTARRRFDQSPLRRQRHPRALPPAAQLRLGLGPRLPLRAPPRRRPVSPGTSPCPCPRRRGRRVCRGRSPLPLLPGRRAAGLARVAAGQHAAGRLAAPRRGDGVSPSVARPRRLGRHSPSLLAPRPCVPAPAFLCLSRPLRSRLRGHGLTWPSAPAQAEAQPARRADVSVLNHAGPCAAAPCFHWWLGWGGGGQTRCGAHREPGQVTRARRAARCAAAARQRAARTRALRLLGSRERERRMAPSTAACTRRTRRRQSRRQHAAVGRARMPVRRDLGRAWPAGAVRALGRRAA